LLVAAVVQGWVLLIVWKMVGPDHGVAAPGAVGAIASLIAMLAIFNAIHRIAPAISAPGIGRFAAAMMAATVVLGFAYAAAAAKEPRYADRSTIATGVAGMVFAVCVMVGYIGALHGAISRMTRPVLTPPA
jgi:hypothetical protein